MRRGIFKIDMRLTLVLLMIAASAAIGAPQDYWYIEDFFSPPGSEGTPGWNVSPASITVGESNSIYVAASDGAVRKVFRYGQDWDFLGSACVAPNVSLHVGQQPDGKIIAVAKNGGGWNLVTMVRFNPDLTTNAILQTDFDLGEQFEGFDTGSNGDIFVASATKVTVFDSSGSYVTNWSGPPGDLTAELAHVQGIAVGPGDKVLVTMGNLGPQRSNEYDRDGNFIRTVIFATLSDRLDIGRDGLIYHVFNVYEPSSGNLVAALHTTLPGASVGVSIQDLAAEDDGALYVTGSNGGGGGGGSWIVRYRRSSYMQHPEAVNNVPEPAVFSVSQRPASTVLDVDFAVYDADDTNITIAALAFLNDGDNLYAARPMIALVDGTATNLGTGLAPGGTRRISWDIGADISTNFVPVSVQILARDSSGMLGFDYITIPSNAPDPELVISRVPVAESDFLAVWYWLVATMDSEVSFLGGVVTGNAAAGASYDGKILAMGDETTDDGRAYLLGRLGVREATASEVLRAREGATPGTVVQNVAGFQIRGRTHAHSRPRKVNEYGVDTFAYAPPDNEHWFVIPPLPLP